MTILVRVRFPGPPAGSFYASATGDRTCWFGLRIQQRDEALVAYRDGFDTAATARAADVTMRSPVGFGGTMIERGRGLLSS